MVAWDHLTGASELVRSFITPSTYADVMSANSTLILESRDMKFERRAVYAETARHDEIFATLIFGWTIGFNFLTILTAWKQTRRLTVYVVLCWLEILASMSYGVIAWCYLMGFVPRVFPVFFFIVISWALQLHCLAQIIVNRICILLHSETKRIRLKALAATVILILNIGVFIIWIPAQLAVPGKWHIINIWYDRTEKVIMLILDAWLNYYFIWIVKKRLVQMGLTKYDALVQFNQKIIILSILMDIMIIAFMSYPNELIYMLFHPVAYSVKLQIEMTMSDLIIRVAKAMDHPEHQPSTSQSHGMPEFDSGGRTTTNGGRFSVSHRTTTKTSGAMGNGDRKGPGLGTISVTVSQIVHEDDASGRTVDLAGDSDSEKVPPLDSMDDTKSRGVVTQSTDPSFIEMDDLQIKPTTPTGGKSHVYFTHVGKN